MRYVLLAMLVLLYPAISTQAQAQTQLGVSIGDRGVSLGFSMSTYPTLAPIPGYPVYYDPQVDENYFFYDGLYWVYGDDNWYSSPWYNGPWDLVSPAYVPLFVLRVPVRYYRRPPSYFRGWRSDAAPRWGQHWGPAWEGRRSGWDQWDRRSVPRAAPLPTYQRNYTGSRYPRQVTQQRSIASRNYRYQPQEAASRRVHEERGRAVPSRSQPQQQRQQHNNRQQNDRQQQEQVNARQQDVQRQQQQQVQHQRDVQQQQRNVRQEQSVQQQQQHARQQQSAQQQQGRQQQAVQQQQRARQQEVQQPRSRQPEVQQQRPRPQHGVEQEQRARPQPPQNARGADNKRGNGHAAEHKNQKDNKKDQKDNHKDGGGH